MSEKVEQYDALTASSTHHKTVASAEGQFIFRNIWEKVSTKHYVKDNFNTNDKSNHNSERKEQKNESKQDDAVDEKKRFSTPSTLASLEGLPIMFANSLALTEWQPTDKSKDVSVHSSVLQSLFTRCAKMAAIMEARDPNLDDKSVTVELPEDLFEGLECNLTREDESWALSINTDSKEDKKILLAAEDSLKARFQEQGLGDVIIRG